MKCFCGGELISKADCLANPDPVLQHVGEAYLGVGDYFCPDEDDVIVAAWVRDGECSREALAESLSEAQRAMREDG